MKTIVETAQPASYAQAIAFLEQQEVVAFPTETVYGLGAIATDEEAVRKIFAAKARPADNPLIVHIGTIEEVAHYITHVPEKARQCMEAFWPGALTLIMEAKPNVLAPSVMAGLSTVGLRMPDHDVALTLLRQLGKPVAAPSANRSGKPSPTEAQHVFEDLAGRIPMVLDGGATGIGVESTVLDMTTDIPTILRPGGVTKEMLEAVIGEVFQPTKLQAEAKETPKAPGMKYTHYAPNAPVYLIEPSAVKIQEAVQQLQMQGHRVAVLAPDDLVIDAPYVFRFGTTAEQMAVRLYDALRACDHTDATIILATTIDEAGVGAAIMNRLEKAAGHQYYR